MRQLALILAVVAAAVSCNQGSTGDFTRALRTPASPTAYDSARGVTVLFGRYDGSGGGETWEWDGSLWTLRATTGPPAREGHALAYDSVRGVTVLFGGYDGSDAGETWEWDGVGWVLRSKHFP